MTDIIDKKIELSSHQPLRVNVDNSYRYILAHNLKNVKYPIV